MNTTSSSIANCGRPQIAQWKRILNIGLPARRRARYSVRLDGRHILCAQRFRRGGSGPASALARACWGVVHMPAMSIAFAAGAIAGQKLRRRQRRAGEGNLQKRPASRHRRDAGFHGAGAVEAGVVGSEPFTKDPETIAVGALFLRMISLKPRRARVDLCVFQACFRDWVTPNRRC